MAGPDLTAVGAAFGRVSHVLLDDPPYVLDAVSITLADEDLLRATQLAGPDGCILVSRDGPRAGWRGTFVGRARFVEDLVGTRSRDGLAQFVILGAGLDTFAQRRPDVAPHLRIFEVDEPSTQRWKQGRLRELGLPIPQNLRFVPVNFESGDSWVRAIADAGFDLGAAAVVASTGVTHYLSVAALTTTLRQAAELAPATTFVCTFVLPAALIDPEERALRSASIRAGRNIRDKDCESFVSLGLRLSA